MANRITIYGKSGEKNTERLRREMRSMSLNYNFYDVTKSPQAVERLENQYAEKGVFPKVEVTLANNSGAVFLSNPDLGTLRQTLYAEEVLGITSYWI